MESREQKWKDVARPLELCKTRVHPTARVPRAPTILIDQTRRYRSRWVEEAENK